MHVQWAGPAGCACALWLLGVAPIVMTYSRAKSSASDSPCRGTMHPNCHSEYTCRKRRQKYFEKSNAISTVSSPLRSAKACRMAPLEAALCRLSMSWCDHSPRLHSTFRGTTSSRDLRVSSLLRGCPWSPTPRSSVEPFLATSPRGTARNGQHGNPVKRPMKPCSVMSAN